jgi:hypothetical protein
MTTCRADAAPVHLEDEVPFRAQRSSGRYEHRHPFGVGEEHLSDIAGHGHEIGTHPGETRRFPFEPSHPPRSRLAAGHVQRRRRRVDPDDPLPRGGEHAGERAGTAANVEHDMRPELIDEGGVHVQVGPTVVDGVIDLGEPRLLEDRIGHEDILPAGERRTGGQRCPHA